MGEGRTQETARTPLDDTVVDQEVGTLRVETSKDRAKTTMVSARLEQGHLDILERAEAAFGLNRSAVLKAAIDALGVALDAPSPRSVDQRFKNTVDRNRPVHVDVDPDVIDGVARLLHRREKEYRALTFQVQRIGHNVNQMARLANAGGHVDVAAVQSVERSLGEILDEMRHLERDDLAASEFVQCLR